MRARSLPLVRVRSIVQDRCFSTDYLTRRVGFAKEIEALPEHQATLRLHDLLEGCNSLGIRPPQARDYKYEMNQKQVVQTIDAMLTAFCLHVESRVASMLGIGYYTIGPCGEEALSSAAHSFEPTDSLALHYRHSGINICRQLLKPDSRTDSLEQLILDRARGYTARKRDPVTGGVHCSIGSETGHDYIVTSTLASQCPSAVGRALGYSFMTGNNNNNNNNKHDDKARPISIVTLGDGSVHNAHFWSAFHLARHARHKNIKCPVLFGISDNGLSISYKTDGYVDTLFDNDPMVQLFSADGNDTMDVYSQTMQATEYVRKQAAPAVILYKNLVRRFGHAATDRQTAYLEQSVVQAMADCDVLESAIVQAVQVLNATTYAVVRDRFAEVQRMCTTAFETASVEEAVDRHGMLQQVSAPQVPVAPMHAEGVTTANTTGKKEVMRKHMARVIAECMQEDASVVYLGEDVIHGGYYVVTEGLANKFPGRVLDFPPDETSLLGAAMGFSQVGLTPIVEIPYSKYLDCGADMFHEIAIQHWISAGKRPAGMVIRLQGFDRGVFGGNFHTSNVLSLPPGVDVCCYSNGHDYTMGFRNAVLQAKAGRVVMSVDCTNLLNLRHLHGKDRGWERSYADSKEAVLGFDNVRRYGTKGSWAIITYGNGVVTALQARKALVDKGIVLSSEDIDIIDCPYLSGIPGGLRAIVGDYRGVLLADICKEGCGVLSSWCAHLKSERLLPAKWELVCAPRTYNPLGSVCTFLNTEDIVRAFHQLMA